MDEFTQSEGFSTEADAGLEGFEAGVEGLGGGEERRGEDDLGGVSRYFEELVDAVAFCEVGFEVGQEVSGFWWR